MGLRAKLTLFTFFLSFILYLAPTHAGGLTRAFDKSDLDRKDLHAFVISISHEAIDHEFEIDLNEDGKPETLIGVLCGNGGCLYYCFENLGHEKFRFIGPLSIHRRGFEVLKTKHHGFNDILSYWHTGAASGSLTRYEFDGQKYQVRKSIKEVSSNLFELLRPTSREKGR